MLKQCVIASVVVATMAAPAAASLQTCKPSGALMRLAGLPEASGLVVSRATAGRLWAHNDSGKAELFALDVNGKVTSKMTVEGAAVEDWEALASAPCDGGHCLFVADIGDNDATRKQITVYRIPEPKAGAAAKVTGVYRATYPDGAHDAEALLAGPDGALYIVTKGDTGSVALYRFPKDLRTDASMKLERVGVLSEKQPAEDARITDGAISADGATVVLRTRSALTFYPAAEFLKGNFRESRRVDLKSLGEPQGEAVSFGPSNTVYVAGEGGGKSQPGTLAVLSCPN
jgi:hypothetical protein